MKSSLYPNRICISNLVISPGITATSYSRVHGRDIQHCWAGREVKTKIGKKGLTVTYVPSSRHPSSPRMQVSRQYRPTTRVELPVVESLGALGQLSDFKMN